MQSGAGRPDELVHENPFLVRSGLNVGDFIAEIVDNCVILGYGHFHTEIQPGKLGKLDVNLLMKNAEPQLDQLPAKTPKRLPNIVSNGDFSIVAAGDIDYKDIKVDGKENTTLNRDFGEMLQKYWKTYRRNFVLIFQKSCGMTKLFLVPTFALTPSSKYRKCWLSLWKRSILVKLVGGRTNQSNWNLWKNICYELKKLKFIYQNRS